MKNKIAIASALAAASSLATAEIKINEFLSFEGFIDASYSHTNRDWDHSFSPQRRYQDDHASENSFGIDQVEIDWLFNFNPITARVDLEHEDADDDVNVEQAFVSYDLGNGVTITAGRYESMLGLEAKEPTGLYQYSRAYDFGFVGDDEFWSDVETLSVLPQYAQGVKITYESNGNVFGLSIQDESDQSDPDRLGGDNDSSYAIEAGASLDLGNGLTWFLGGAFEDADAGDSYVLNSHLTYVSGPWTFGAEIVYADKEDSDDGFEPISEYFGEENEEVLQALIMANYAYSDSCSITARISHADYEDGDSWGTNYTKFTLAHNNAITDNLAVITEVSYVDGEEDDVGDDWDYEALIGAVEVRFTF